MLRAIKPGLQVILNLFMDYILFRTITVILNKLVFQNPFDSHKHLIFRRGGDKYLYTHMHTQYTV